VDALRDPDPWRTFDVVLVTVGDKKVQVIKKVRGLTGLSLTEAKNCVEAAPSVVLERVASAQATKAREELESVGATVSLPVADVDVDVPRNKGPGGAFDVVLETVGDKKIQVSKKVRELTGLGLRETVDLVNGAPQIVLRRVNQDRATKARDQLEALGATVSLQQPGTRPTRGPEQGQG
jgi:ribosomal protein L7/L12